MKTEIKPGATIESLTQDELRETLAELLSGYSRGPQTIRTAGAVTLDDNGDGSVDVFKVPLGHRISLHRLVVEFEGSTPGDPYVSATGYAAILRNGQLVDFSTFSGGVPNVGTWGNANGPVFTNGEVIVVQIVDGPADGQGRISIQGTLQNEVEE